MIVGLEPRRIRCVSGRTFRHVIQSVLINVETRAVTVNFSSPIPTKYMQQRYLIKWLSEKPKISHDFEIGMFINTIIV